MKILFPTDFSSAAENAFVYALKLANQLNASITVLHVYELLQVHTWIEGSMNMEEVNEKITLGEFEDFRSRSETMKRIALENNLDQVDVNYSLKESNHVVDAILQDASMNMIDLIVIGTKGATGLREIFFGSVASKVMESSFCPVLLVPDTAVFKGIEKFGLTLEYKPDELELIERAATVTRRFGGHLYCLHVDAFDPDKVTLKMQEYRETFKHESDISFHVHHNLDIEKGILEFMKLNQVDIVMMRVHHQSLLKELFSYSIAKRVAYHTDIPLLGIHLA
ncbi:MAG TPA: universal stress protein [Saprospiraceae bacterium]|jgi:nucleotide-binding universal stress UspA family protein